MESIIRNVKDIAGADRRGLEHVVGHELSDNQQVIIRVVEMEVIPNQQAKAAALDNLRKLSEQGSLHRQSQGCSEAEIDDAIEEAVRETRRQKRPSAE